jgi:hypothetical protein
MYNGIPLQDKHFDNLEGVFIVWLEEDEGLRTVMLIGKGKVRDGLKQFRGDPKLQIHELKGTLFATWADVPETKRAGVESFLMRKFNPKLGQSFSAAKPIDVNVPW